MIDSGVVDLVIGLMFVFLVFSLVVSGINEGITRVLSWRSKHLWSTLRQLLDDEKSTDGDQRPRVDVRPNREASRTERLYAHPLIQQLERTTAVSKRTQLANIPSTDFSRALIELLVPDKEGTTSVDDVREKVREIPDARLRKSLLAIVNEAGDRFDQLRQGIGQWFDARMEALSHLYRQKAKWLLLFVGLGVAVAFNVDAIDAGQRLYRDEALRAAVAEQATAVVTTCEGSDDVAECTETEVEKVDRALTLPVGWTSEALEEDIDILQVLGWLIAGIALGQGAPFWFDLLRKAGRLRR